MELYLRDQATILADVEARLRDSGNARWSDAEIYRALNDTLLTWHGRVSIPHVYTVTGGWTANTNEYTLPAYINSRTIVPQMKRSVPASWLGDITLDDSLTWVNIAGWELEPTATNGVVLRFDVPPYAAEGRLIWYGVNAPVPTTVPTLSAQLAADGTSAVLVGVVDCADYGWVLIDTEWMQYSGVTRSTTTTLTNLVRAHPNGTAAAIHTSTTAVKFGVAMPRTDLYRVLLEQVFVFLHELYLTDASPRETGIHQQLVGFYADRVAKFWRSWIPVRPPRIILDRKYSLVE